MRRVLFALMVTGPFVAGQPANWAEAVAGEPADRYTVPQGGTEELMQFIGELSEFRPGTPDEDLQHRGKFRRALQQAAEKLVKLEKDPKSEARQAATFILLNNRTRWIAQADPHAQKQTIVDVAAYLKDQGAKGPGEVAARLANSLGETLEGMGELDLAADAYKQFAAAVAQGKAQELADVAARMEDESRRLADKSKSVAPAGSKPKIAPKGRLVPIDLHSKVNRKLIASSGSAFQENHLGELPRGEQTFAGVRFRIGDGVIETAGANQLDRPEKVEGLVVDRKTTRIYFLHGTQWRDVDGTQIGHYVVHYEDGATASIPIVYGQDVRDWWATEDRIPVTRARVAWTGTNPPIERFKTVLRLYLAVWENPHPEKKIARLDFCSACKTPCAPFSVAITVEEPASLPAEPPQRHCERHASPTDDRGQIAARREEAYPFEHDAAHRMNQRS
ncbi:MAG: hypothetical protein ACLQNE_41970 [Thermoguttaceae bacterium]